jgi:hypothetical protein
VVLTKPRRLGQRRHRPWPCRRRSASPSSWWGWRDGG